jgi:hypothetical protein
VHHRQLVKAAPSCADDLPMLLTALDPPRHEFAVRPATPHRYQEPAELGAFALLAVGAVWVERHGAGLEGLTSVVPGLVTTLPLLALCRAWRLPLTWLLLCAALPVSIIVTAAVAPGGWAGSERSAAYGYGALTFAAVVALPGRRCAG